MKEVWRDIPGYEGWYSMSSLGRVRRDAFACSRTKDGVLKQYYTRRYMSVILTRYGIAKTYRVHRLVLNAFIGPPPTEIHQGNHKDGNTKNNCPSNLEWATPSENKLHAIHVLGKWPDNQGERHPRSFLTDKQIIDIRRRYRRRGSVDSGKSLASEFGTTRGNVSLIVNNKAWHHLSVPCGEKP